MVPVDGIDAPYLIRVRESAVMEADYPRIGRWPPREFWKYRVGGSSEVAGRLPGTVRNREVGGGVNFEFYVPVDADHYRRVLLVTSLASGRDALWLRMWYRLYGRKVYHGWFNDQDQRMIETMQVPPEQALPPGRARSRRGASGAIPARARPHSRPSRHRRAPSRS